MASNSYSCRREEVRSALINLLAVLAIVAFSTIVLLLFTRPKILAALSVAASVLAPTIQNVFKVPYVEYADESLILLTALSAMATTLWKKSQFRWLPGGTGFLLFVAFAIASTIQNGVPLTLASQDAFLLLKGVIFAGAVAQLNWNYKDLECAVRIGAVFIVLLLVATAVNLILGEQWNSFFTSSSFRDRNDLGTIIGIFPHPGPLGQIMALAAIALISYRTLVRKSAFSLILMIGASLSVLLSTRRKAIVGLTAVLAWFGFTRKPLATSIALIILTPIFILLFGSHLIDFLQRINEEYFVNPDGAARTVLYTSSVSLANAAFPLGVGLARFGTYIAAENYSPVYEGLGFPTVWGLQPGGSFLTDTFWPAVLGEGGWIAFGGYALGLLMLTRASIMLMKQGDTPVVRWLGTVSTLWSLEYLLESVAQPVYVSPPTYLLLFFAYGLVTAFRGSMSTHKLNSFIPRSRLRILQ